MDEDKMEFYNLQDGSFSLDARNLELAPINRYKISIGGMEKLVIGAILKPYFTYNRVLNDTTNSLHKEHFNPVNFSYENQDDSRPVYLITLYLLNKEVIIVYHIGTHDERSRDMLFHFYGFETSKAAMSEVKPLMSKLVTMDPKAITDELARNVAWMADSAAMQMNDSVEHVIKDIQLKDLIPEKITSIVEEINNKISADNNPNYSSWKSNLDNKWMTDAVRKEAEAMRVEEAAKNGTLQNVAAQVKKSPNLWEIANVGGKRRKTKRKIKKSKTHKRKSNKKMRRSRKSRRRHKKIINYNRKSAV